MLPISLMAQKSDIDQIKTILDNQKKAWNKGNIDEFMLGYWRSDSLTFVGSRGLTFGWQTTLENYKKSYPTPEKMGKLEFQILKVELLSSHTAFMLGSYTLTRKEDNPTGIFTLIWKKINGRWVIICDQTCG